ncbi:cysteine hydrolase family protein [Sinorhizobium fredii]|uniref:Cysteine hydrolase n=1 Tax=Rhizobium fredii TaxID=380 RepID=A0A2A6M316_RHIFR|nr:isochorismatase family cysteine hydrolase [Sinorhizobium fredii]ASY70098.1 Amidases related to nicotinamidase [Sinorhizobium fredii CCBAU 83666]PDT48967.1 cysteine hydrolase [Sinorhizobium fredii]
MNPEKWIHLCIDMQRMFAEGTPWQVAWMPKVFDQVAEVAARFPDRTIFTRFVPPASPEELPGMWRAYYEKWPMMTTAELDPDLVDLVPDLKKLVPPAHILDKTTYSPWTGGRLHGALTRQDIGTLVVTGGETDICVLAATIGAIDLGYKVILLKDAVCSTTDQTHDASLELLGNRFSVQVEVISTEKWLSSH